LRRSGEPCRERHVRRAARLDHLGHLTITEGVAEALGLAAEVKPVAPRWLWRNLAPRGPADPKALKALLEEPLPGIVFGAGRQTVPFVRALKRAGQGRVFAVIFQAPKAGADCSHLIWTPEHDRLAGANVITTLVPPHRFSPERLRALRREVPADIAALPSPRVALFLGGPGGSYDWSPASIAAFAQSLGAVAPLAGSFLITPSRRTPPALLRVASEVTSARPRILWDGRAENPYPQFLAHADVFIVTADSVNMAGEAAATGRPVYVFTPPGGRSKFQRFHAALASHGATRPLPASAPSALGGWAYEPLHAAATVAAEIERRWRSFQSTNGAC
jgi:mitochondrial fission protein ELM1